MRTFTGYQYLQIDIANNYGLDKKSWDDRITWVESIEAATNEDVPICLEDYTEQTDNPMLYAKAVHALRDVQAGKSTGHVMGLDACSSGKLMPL